MSVRAALLERISKPGRVKNIELVTILNTKDFHYLCRGSKSLICKDILDDLVFNSCAEKIGHGIYTICADAKEMLFKTKNRTTYEPDEYAFLNEKKVNKPEIVYNLIKQKKKELNIKLVPSRIILDMCNEEGVSIKSLNEYVVNKRNGIPNTL